MRQLLSGVALVLALWPAVALAGGDDVILLTNGGRLRGTVMEADPERGVRFLLADGGVRFLLPSDIVEIRYGGQPGAAPPPPAAPPPASAPPGAAPPPAQPMPPPPAAPAAAPAPAPAPAPYNPPPPPPEARHERREGGAASKTIQLGARLGYAAPMGSVWGSDSINGFNDYSAKDAFSYKIPFGIEASFGVSKRFAIGASVYYGFISDNTGPGSGCEAPNECSDHDWELGLFALINFAPDRFLNPYIGFGFGYEIEVWSFKSPEFSNDGTLTGLQYLKLQGGLDFKVSEGVSIGPYASYSLGIYTSRSSSAGGDEDLPPAFHEWATLGIRGSFGLIDRDFDD